MMRGMRPFIAALLLALALPATSQAYRAVPNAPPAHGCTTTTAVLATFQANVNTAPAGTTQCLSNGTYAALATFNRTAAGLVTAASVSGYGAVITGGMAINGGSIYFEGLDVQNNANATNAGDCIREAAGVIAGVTIGFSKVHNCYRNGITQVRPACQAPCTPQSGYAGNLMIGNDRVYDVGNTDLLGDLIILRGDNNSVSSNDIGDDTLTSPNDAILAYGNNNTVYNNNIHGLVVPFGGAGHPDIVQTTANPGGDGAQGLPLTNFAMTDNLAWGNTDVNGHFLIAEGLGHGPWTVRSNVVRQMGGIDVILGSSSPTGSPTGVKFTGNTFDGGADTDALVSIYGTTAVAPIFASNAFYAAGGLWSLAGSATATRDYDSYYGGTTFAETHGQYGNPLFASPGTGDFHLGAGSPLINAGDNGALLAESIVGADIDGQSRILGTANDIGADEVQ
jgi:hypothetical protein